MEEEFVSLFDYLGHPAGAGLGLEVATAAGKAGEPVNIKFVKNPKYEGPINMFRREFLDQYFKK